MRLRARFLSSTIVYVFMQIALNTMRFWARVPKRMSKKGNLCLSLRFFPEAGAQPVKFSSVCACRLRLFTFASYISTRVCAFISSISRWVLVHASHAYQVHLQPDSLCGISHAQRRLTGHAATIFSKVTLCILLIWFTTQCAIDAHGKKCNGLRKCWKTSDTQKCNSKICHKYRINFLLKIALQDSSSLMNWNSN